MNEEQIPVIDDTILLYFIDGKIDPVANCHWPRCRLPNGSCDEGRNCNG
jgi:hypothetical protein